MLNTACAESFEKSFSLRLEKLIHTLPPDAVSLQINSQADFIAFKILPTNQESARIVGEASTQGGITFTVGRATGVELGTSQEERFFQLCEAIFTSKFSESLVYSSEGRLLFSKIRLEIKERYVRLGGNRLLWRLFPNKRCEVFQYQPYI